TRTPTRALTHTSTHTRTYTTQTLSICARPSRARHKRQEKNDLHQMDGETARGKVLVCARSGCPSLPEAFFRNCIDSFLDHAYTPDSLWEDVGPPVERLMANDLPLPRLWPFLVTCPEFPSSTAPRKPGQRTEFLACVIAPRLQPEAESSQSMS